MLHVIRFVLGCFLVAVFVVALLNYTTVPEHLARLEKRLIPMQTAAAGPSAAAEPAKPTSDAAPAAPSPPASANSDAFTVEVEPIPAGLTGRGTSFPLGNGLWLTARHVVGNDCSQIVLIIGGSNVFATIKYLDPNADLAVLQTAPIDVPALPIGAEEPADDSNAFSFGFPKGVLGGTADQLLGRTHMKLGGRLAGLAPVLTWSELDRSPESFESIAGISGGPMLDEKGHVIGIIVAASVRRGRNYTVAPEVLQAIENELGINGPQPDQSPASDVVKKPVVLDSSAKAMARNSRIALTYCITPES